MDATTNSELYFFCKERISEDLTKADIRELVSESFPEATKDDFDVAYGTAFSNHKL